MLGLADRFAQSVRSPTGDATHTHLRIFPILIVGIVISLGPASRRHMVALVRAIIPMMTESYIDGLQSPAVALVRSPLKRLVVSAIVIFTLAGLAGCFAYFVVGPAPVSQSVALAAPPATPAWSSTTGRVGATDTPTVVDRLRLSDEDIVKAFRLATEDPVVAQGAVFYTDQQPIAGPVPLPKRRPPPRP